MASLPIPEVGPLRAPQGAHLLLSVGIPAVFWNLVVFWVSGSGPNWPVAPLGLLYALILGFWAPWRQRTRQGPMLKLWLWLVSTLLLYAALALADGRPWPTTFLFEGLHLLWFLPAFLQGQLTALWAGQLSSRARLYQLIEGFSSGKALEDRVRDFQLDADFSRSNEATLSASLVVLCVLCVGAASFSPYGRDGTSVVLMVSFLVLCLLVGVMLRTYRREMEALMYGRRFSAAEKWAPLAWSSVLVAAAGLGAWGLLAIGPWVDWNQILQGRHEPVPPSPEEQELRPPLPAPTGEGDHRFAVLMALLQIIFRVQNLVAVVEFFIRSLAWLVPWAIVAFLIWPLARWLLSGGRETRGLGRRWWDLLVPQWKAFLEVLAGWWRRPDSTVEGALGDTSNAREWLRSLFKRPAASRRVPYAPVVEAFLSLVRWAEPVTGYRRGETTREYLDRLLFLLPEAVSLAEVRDLLDKELFAPRGLDAAGRTAFLSLVAALTASPPSHDSPAGVS